MDPYSRTDYFPLPYLKDSTPLSFPMLDFITIWTIWGLIRRASPSTTAVRRCCSPSPGRETEEQGDNVWGKNRVGWKKGREGDVELDIETYELFLAQFQCWGGRYDVRTKKETLKGIYDISVKYPFLAPDALEEIWFVYIHDQFEEYHLADALEIFIRYYGMTDKALLTYIEYIDERAKNM